MSENILFKEKLDESGDYLLVTNCVCDELYQRIISFSVVLLLKRSVAFVEVIKYDASQRERVNVHKYYLKDRQKEYLDKDISFDTLQEYLDDIRNNWQRYVLLFEKNRKYNI